MSSRHLRRRVVRCTSIEPLEARQMFSAEPIGGALGGSFEHHAVSTPDFWYDTNLDRELDAMLGDVEQTLAAANELTGLTQARNDYGFLGYGQTVAVIDSGIAWDHPNLGAGFGSDYRVVGGWDFSEENDANPYDDGPSGAHGTHVAGIVGATSNNSGDEGVAPGVELVGLRVFNDQGAGYFGWVEKALRWVHTNRNAFDNPITAVNLSLGTAWNAATVPSWAMLEDEFAQLKADGIFVSVSAGNSFTSYHKPGLSYPAASASVVPVMSVDDNGTLSYFSQRHERAIAAPGRTIRSTVPDYVGNQNGRTDDWASFSGTSMAAPYVAGASVLVREAMEFVGTTNVTQDTIYEHMLSTADEIFDTATNAFYKRLNIGAALDDLMPEDDFGSTTETAFDLGTIGSAGTEVTGLVGKRDDVDCFRFTAAASGTVTFAATTSHYLAAQWTGDGVASDDGLTYTINVVAGRSYTVGLASSAGVGHFELRVTAASEFKFVDWGVVAQQQHLQGVAVQGESWYGVTAQQAGYLTAEAFYSNNCHVELTWFDANLQRVASGTAAAGCERVDGVSAAGERLFLRVSGASNGVDFRLTNLVALDGDTLVVTGTEADDTLAFSAGTAHHIIVVNGVEYVIDAANVSSIQIDATGGNDTITVRGTAGNDNATLSATSARLDGDGYSITAQGFEKLAVDGGGGSDGAQFDDTAGDDTLTADRESATMSGAAYVISALGFSLLNVNATTGFDRATLHDTAGDDTFVSRPEYGRLAGADYALRATNFDEVVAISTAGGNDRAVMYDSSGDDTLALRQEYARLVGAGFYVQAQGFTTAQVYATGGGRDRANFYDSSGNDEFVATTSYARLSGTGYYYYGTGFELVYAYANAGGADRAILYDSAGDDQFAATSDYARLSGSGFYNYTKGFESASAFTSSGNDVAVLRDSQGDDVFVARPEYGRMSGAGFNNYAGGFDRVEASSIAGGLDLAYLYDSAGDDEFVARPEYSSLTGAGFYNFASGFDRVYAYATAGGNDRASLYDSLGNDQFVAQPEYGRISGSGFYNYAKGFRSVSGYSSGVGADDALLSASTSDVQASHGEDYVRLNGSQFDTYAEGFSAMTMLVAGQPPVNLRAVDVVFDQVGG